MSKGIYKEQSTQDLTQVYRSDYYETMITKEEIKGIKRLHQSKERNEQGLFVIEGVRLLEEAVKEGVPLEQVLYTARIGESPRGDKILEALFNLHIQASQVPESVMGSISETDSPQGVLGVARQLPWAFKDITIDKRPVIIACGLQDPGNLGTIIRTADAGACGGVITTLNSTDIYNSKTIRATMGSIFRLPVLKIDDPKEAISKLKEEGYQIIATTAASSLSYLDIDCMRPTAFLIGQEGAGLSDEVLSSADARVFIPMKDGVESLNAAVSASILIYEAFRQRSSPRP